MHSLECCHYVFIIKCHFGYLGMIFLNLTWSIQYFVFTCKFGLHFVTLWMSTANWEFTASFLKKKNSIVDLVLVTCVMDPN